MPIQWDSGMDTGDQTVDEQHKGLVALFNALLEAENHADPHQISAVLEQLCEYVIVHFAAEEALMTRVAYPPDAVDAHLAEHRALTERTRDMVLDFRTGRLESVVPLVEFLRGWLSEHIAKCDRAMVEHARSGG